MRLLAIANCNGQSLKQIFLASGHHSFDHVIVRSPEAERLTSEDLDGYDVIFAQLTKQTTPELLGRLRQHRRLIPTPILVCNCFTPDRIAVQALPSAPVAPWGNISRIMLASWARGLSVEQTVALYNVEFMEAIGYYKDYDAHRDLFIEYLSDFITDADKLFAEWYDRGVFFHTGNHPKSFVVEGIIRSMLRGSDIRLPDVAVSSLLPDPLANNPINPHLNHPAATNLLDRKDHVYVMGGRLVPLVQKIRQTFSILDSAKGHFVEPTPDLARFDAAYTAWTGRAPEPMRNPYASRPPHNFWSRAVARPAVAAVTPGDGLRPVIGRATRVATAGSCFAQHVARAMVSDGLTYYVAETAPEGMDAATATAQGYGLFSARYGNIYSTRQLLQLIRRAYGRFTPVETAWPVEGGFIDPFRPNIGETFASVAALEAARADHLAQVRRMFETLDVFVFTLGLTEGWVDRRDGAAYPVTPGAVTKQADPAHFAFQNLDYPAVKADFVAFLGELFAVNPKAQVVLTVSPVPLIATYGEDDALSATTYSKSVLRAAAGDVAALFDAVQYFPSYEIITGGFTRGAYFEADLRGVRHEGVDHVMRVFRERLVTGAETVAAAAEPPPAAASDRQSIADEIARQMAVVCDEELQVRGI